MSTTEPALSPEAAARTRGLRTGWTTGSCASAAAKAAVTGLLRGTCPTTVDVGLPDGRRVAFAVEPGADASEAVVVKDAGDDPDCTDGARMTATAAYATVPFPALDLRAGPGIGTVTKPGLGIPVGAPSITAVPRRMIGLAVEEARAGRPDALVVTFSVPGGQAMAARTSNARLGIEGGISILGTSGIVRPFSTAAYRASVIQQVDVAAAQGLRTIVLATGGRSDRAAQGLRTDLPPVCFVEVGDYTGIALRRAAGAGMADAVWVGMAGKIAKLAAGVLMTHFHRSAVDGQVLAAAARAAGASPHVVAAATETATARHFFESCVAAGEIGPLTVLCQKAADACRSHTGDALAVEVIMVDFDGAGVIARAAA